MVTESSMKNECAHCAVGVQSLGRMHSAPRHYYTAKASTWHPPLVPKFGSFSRTFIFSRVHAEKDLKNVDTKESGKKIEETSKSVLDDNTEEKKLPSPAMEVLARRYIESETGMDRVRMIFKKDHKGNSSPEMEYIKLALLQTFIISFFIKYVPSWREAKREFVRQNQATVFRTRLEAVRKMQDHVSLVAAREGGSFSAKLTFFSAGFLFLSQMIASYRNKTTPFEYVAAAGITGGLARLQLGLRGVIAGSFLGMALGSVAGGLAYVTMKAYSFTQQERHLAATISLLEVEKSIVGESAFKEKVKKVVEEMETAA